MQRQSGGQPAEIVGITADGVLADADVVCAADVVIAADRHFAWLPRVSGQLRLTYPTPLRAGIAELFRRYANRRVAVVASGDPLVFGIADLLISMLGRDRVRVCPAVSSVALARAAMGWPANMHAVVRMHGPDVSLLRRELAPGRRILLLSADEHTPTQVGRLLAASGYRDSTMTVLGDLVINEQSAETGSAHQWASAEAAAPRLNIVAIDCTGPALGGSVAGLPDAAFEHDGAITKRDLRASALARLAPMPGEYLWDIGAGAGSVGIEWMRAHPTCRATAIEGSTERAERIGRNAANLGVPGLHVLTGRAPEAMADLAAPDAIFVGGGAAEPGVIDGCLDALQPGGRLVIHAVTLQTEQILARLHTRYGGELIRIQTQTAAPLGSYTGWTPGRPVTQWSHAAEQESFLVEPDVGE